MTVWLSPFLTIEQKWAASPVPRVVGDMNQIVIDPARVAQCEL